MWWIMGAAFAADVWVTVQGDVSGPDGNPLDGGHTLLFSVYPDESTPTPLFTQTVSLLATRGAFSAALGAGTSTDDTLWDTDAPRFLTVTVGGVESARTPVGWTARAWYAERAGHLGAYTPEQVVVDGEAIPWSAVQAAVTPHLPGTAEFRAAVESDPTVALTGGLTGTTGAFTSTLAANGGLTGTTGAFSATLAANGGLTGTTGTFSSTLAANGGLTGTTGSFSSTLAANGGLTGTTGSFSSTLAANGGLTGTTGAFSSTLAANGGLTATTGRFTGNVGVGTATPQATLDVAGGVRLGNATTCDANTAGTLRYVASNGSLELCHASNWTPLSSAYYRSCREIRDGGRTTDGWYTIDPDGPATGAPLTVWCDLSTDGGGWTLAVNIASDLGAIDLSTYTAASSTPLTANYGVNMSQFTRSTATEYRLTCVESSDNANRKLFLRGIVPGEAAFVAAGTVATKAGVQCASTPSFSDAVTGAGCWGSDDGVHTYYTHTGADINWALFNGGSAYTLRHCRPVGTGYFNRGAVWFR